MRGPVLFGRSSTSPSIIALAAAQSLAAALALVLCPAAVLARQPATTATWITAEHMLDVRSGRMVDKPHLLVRHGRVAQVGSGSVPVPAGVRHVDLAGMTLLPGLIDMHVHLDSDPSYGG